MKRTYSEFKSEENLNFFDKLSNDSIIEIVTFIKFYYPDIINFSQVNKNIHNLLSPSNISKEQRIKKLNFYKINWELTEDEDITEEEEEDEEEDDDEGKKDKPIPKSEIKKRMRAEKISSIVGPHVEQLILPPYLMKYLNYTILCKMFEKCSSSLKELIFNQFTFQHFTDFIEKFKKTFPNVTKIYIMSKSFLQSPENCLIGYHRKNDGCYLNIKEHILGRKIFPSLRKIEMIYLHKDRVLEMKKDVDRLLKNSFFLFGYDVSGNEMLKEYFEVEKDEYLKGSEWGAI